MRLYPKPSWEMVIEGDIKKVHNWLQRHNTRMWELSMLNIFTYLSLNRMFWVVFFYSKTLTWLDLIRQVISETGSQKNFLAAFAFGHLLPSVQLQSVHALTVFYTSWCSSLLLPSHPHSHTHSLSVSLSSFDPSVINTFSVFSFSLSLLLSISEHQLTHPLSSCTFSQ